MPLALQEHLRDLNISQIRYDWLFLGTNDRYFSFACIKCMPSILAAQGRPTRFTPALRALWETLQACKGPVFGIFILFVSVDMRGPGHITQEESLRGFQSFRLTR